MTDLLNLMQRTGEAAGGTAPALGILLRVTVLLHEPVDPQDWPDRKAMSAVVWRTVAQGADRLRQNREPAPIRNG